MPPVLRQSVSVFYGLHYCKGAIRLHDFTLHERSACTLILSTCSHLLVLYKKRFHAMNLFYRHKLISRKTVRETLRLKPFVCRLMFWATLISCIVSQVLYVPFMRVSVNPVTSIYVHFFNAQKLDLSTARLLRAVNGSPKTHACVKVHNSDSLILYLWRR